MIYLPDVRGVKLVRVFDRGVPNKECIALLVTEQTEMAQYGLMVGWLQGPKVAVPIKDFLFYFGSGAVKKGDWIFVFTGAGESKKAPSSDGLSTIYSLYWGRPSTLFANSNIVPVLFQVGALDVADAPQDQPQLGALPSR